MSEKVNISLEILLLNDLLRTNVIDIELYEKASQKIETISTTNIDSLPTFATA